jgi:hypothetical protein
MGNGMIVAVENLDSMSRFSWNWRADVAPFGFPVRVELRRSDDRA